MTDNQKDIEDFFNEELKNAKKKAKNAIRDSQDT